MREEPLQQPSKRLDLTLSHTSQEIFLRAHQRPMRAGDLVTVTTSAPGDTLRAAARIPAARDLTSDGPTVEFRVPQGNKVLPEFLKTAEVRRPTLDDLFLALTGLSIREGAPA
ncbi:hypothetical protein AB5J62_37255 [Amycolatopsis sp. cg5]|uniref:hypothetical protein n=1 Tax=Amycolatopsis sp. cg5 TaxID=3238802 RepID=UPI0035250D67